MWYKGGVGNLILFLLLFLSRLLFLSPLPIYFDSPEYIKLIANPNLLHALTLGHEPIHPGFILPAWLLYRALPLNSLYSAEIISSLFSALSLFTFFKIAEIYFSKRIAVRALIIASLVPSFYLAGVNALTDTTYIFFYLFSFYALSKSLQPGRKNIWNRWFWLGTFSLGYSIFTHTQVILWLPLFFTPLLFRVKFTKKVKDKALNQGSTLKLICLFIGSGIGMGIISLVFLMVATGNSVISSLNLLFMHGGDFITSQNVFLAFLRALRNLAITLLRNNSTILVLYAIIGAVILTSKNKKQVLFLLFWLFPVILTSQYWHIGLFGRTSLLASFPLSILAVQIKSKLLLSFLFIQLVIITIPLAFTNKNADVQNKLVSMYEDMPKNALLISSNLIRPQVTFYGEKYFINEPGQDIEFIELKINSALLQKRPVYIDSQAVFNPYYSLDGNNLHILSLGKRGDSKVSELFKQYRIQIVSVQDWANRIYLYQINPYTKYDHNAVSGKASPGSEIFLYPIGLHERVHPLRIDYHDAGTWVWAILTKKKDPVLWTIADKNGEYTLH